MTRPARRALAGEEGVAVVTVAIWLPVLILFAAFAIDVGNWFLHDRHLQLQADAGALAAAGDLRYPCDDEAIEERARQYAGADTGAYNQQVGGTPSEDVHFALNSRTYPEQPAKTDPTAVEGPPCRTGAIDVKLTETELPLFFRVAGLFTNVPFINAHARVQAFQMRTIRHALPVAVPDPNPQSARVTFIDEQSGEVLGSRQLTRDGTEGKLAIWDNATEPLPLKVNSGQIGMRVSLGGGESTTCGEPLVACYDAGSANGIVFVRGFSMAGSGAQPGPPLARGAYLFVDTASPNSCPDPYFSAGGCSVGLHADVDFGPCEELAKVGAKLTAVAGGTRYPLSLAGEGSCPAGSHTSSWETAGEPIPVPPGAGPVPVTLEWAETKGSVGGNACSEGGGNKCSGSFGAVQRGFASSDERSGPIRLARVEANGGYWADSLERCSAAQSSCTYGVVAKIGIEQNLLESAKNPEEPPVALRVFQEAANNPSQNQSLDCDPATPSLREEIAFGCAPEYERNQGTACPAPNALWSSPAPWQCTAIQTGGAVNQVFQGMNTRVNGAANATECAHPNEWPNVEPGDPRVVPVFVTAFGSFSGSGNGTVPVTNFATFYVTGWAGQGAGNSSKSICPTDDPAPAGTIVGHFITYVQALNDGSASEKPCDFNSPTPCVAVLTE